MKTDLSPIWEQIRSISQHKQSKIVKNIFQKDDETNFLNQENSKPSQKTLKKLTKQLDQQIFLVSKLAD